MVTSGKVSIIWQIIFVVIIPFGYVWAFYKIEKMRKMILYVELPTIALMLLMDALILFSGFPLTEEEVEIWEPDPEFFIPIIIGLVGFAVITSFAIYFVYKWSVEWNQKFDNIKSSV